MKYRSGFWILFGLGCMGMLAGSVWSSQPDMIGKFDQRMEVVSHDPATGLTTVTFTLAPQQHDRPECDLISYRILSTDRLEVLSASEWQLPLIDTQTVTARLDLRLPLNDTTGLVLLTECADWSHEWMRYFGTVGDTVAIYPSHPATWPPLGFEVDSIARRLAWEEIERQLAEQRQTRRPVLGRCSTYTPVAPGDRALADSLSEDGLTRLAIMHPPRTAECSLEPLGKPVAGQPLLLQHTVVPLASCDTLALRLRRAHNVVYLGQQTWEVPASTGIAYIDTLEVVLPDSGEGCIDLEVICDRWRNFSTFCFQIYPDSVHVCRGLPLSRQYLPPDEPKYTPPPPRVDALDTLTEEQLDVEYKVTVRPADSLQRLQVERVLERPLSDSMRRPDGSFHLSLSLRTLLQLKRQDVYWKFLEPPPWDQPGSPDKAGALEQPPPMELESSQESGIYLDHVDGLVNGAIPVNEEITFYFRIVNNYGFTVQGMTNGFRVWSPDGADWAHVVADTLPVGWGSIFNGFWIRTFSANGSGADTVGFTCLTDTSNGMPPGFNEVVYTITVGPIPDYYAGDHLCIDSSFFGASGAWMWSPASGTPYIPAWSGDTCFEIISNTVAFRGYLRYWDPRPGQQTWKPMRRVRIEMWDEDMFIDDLLDDAVTDDSGFFQLGPITNDDGFGSGTLDVFLRVYAENDATWVTDSYDGDTYRIQTPVAHEIASGVYDTTISAPDALRGAFFVADALLHGCRDWVTLSNGVYLTPFETVWSTEPGTYYHTLERSIHIDARNLPMYWLPHTYTMSAILHELGHLIEFDKAFLDKTAHEDSSHTWFQEMTSQGAACEGFADFISGVLSGGDPTMRLFAFDFAETLWIDLETGEMGQNIATYATANTMGRNCEGAVAGILWDIFDTPHDNQSGRSDWGDTTLPHTPDAIGDTLADGITNILSTLLDRTITDSTGTHHPRTLDEFWACWFQPTSFGHTQAMRDIRWEHGDSLGCCLGIRGNANGDPDDLINVADLTFLIEYLFRGGPTPPCPEEGDVNGYSGTNVSDITQIIAFLFRGGPAPEPCS